MKRLMILFAFSLFFFNQQSVEAQVWSGSAVSTQTNDNSAIGTIVNPNIKLRLSNNLNNINRNLYSVQSGGYNGTQYSLDSYVKTTGSGTKYGLRSFIYNEGSGTKYAVHAHAYSAYPLANSGRNIAIFGQANRKNPTNDRAGLFQGETEVVGGFMVGNTIGKYRFAVGSGDYLSITANGVGTADSGYKNNRQIRFYDSGELIKYIDAGSTNALVVRLGTTDNFVVKGDGRVFAREVEVTLSPFPDYVFDDSYELMPLNKLETYIEENPHLPNMPSAAEVAENGLGLGDLSIKQMEKIEELTLYILEMNKRLEKLEKENEELRQTSGK